MTTCEVVNALQGGQCTRGFSQALARLWGARQRSIAPMLHCKQAIRCRLPVPRVAPRRQNLKSRLNVDVGSMRSLMSQNRKSVLRVLLVEDSEDDAVLLLRELQRGEHEIQSQRVCSSDALRAALVGNAWDVILTDHNMPGFSSEEALRIVKQMGVDAPVIIVSGSIGEDVAVEAMKAGAHDYIIKGNWARLLPAVSRELREANVRRAHRRAEQTIHHLAFHDSLTGLVNRYEFESRLKHVLHELKSTEKQHALLYIDLDQFKLINDTSGHMAGDELLQQLAAVLKEQIRDSDTLARLGGDEFGVLLPNCPLSRAQEIASHLLHAISAFRFIWADKPFSISCSIGLVPLDDSATPLSDVLRAADLACYAAKEMGRNRVHVYNRDDAALLQRHGEMEWVTRLQRALEEDRFVLYRQQIVGLSAGNGKVGYEELLLRLRDERGELVPPGAFIPAAERYNLMPALDRWVVRHAVKYVATGIGGSGQSGMCFINLSGASLGDETFCRFVQEQIASAGVAPGRLCFEITETSAISHLAHAISFISKVREVGCHFALDDFGAGLSSFSYLKALPVDFLKIDGAFIQDLISDPMDFAIVDAINRIGHVAKLKTVAEHVENEETMEALRKLGVDYAQGFHVHRPVAIEF